MSDSMLLQQHNTKDRTFPRALTSEILGPSTERCTSFRGQSIREFMRLWSALRLIYSAEDLSRNHDWNSFSCPRGRGYLNRGLMDVTCWMHYSIFEGRLNKDIASRESSITEIEL